MLNNRLKGGIMAGWALWTFASELLKVCILEVVTLSRFPCAGVDLQFVELVQWRLPAQGGPKYGPRQLLGRWDLGKGQGQGERIL